ncbi:unnamed protein product [Cladocopium goreaui]|uniref:Uncharacterized protein n=1 Tax=Cladocopium goreaui TaxID=2562237 RepID=A0A9P1DSI0_9DINO|nr:unnamed protein product [Cladocopium goreaui]
MLIEVLASWVPDEGKFTVYERILGSTAEVGPLGDPPIREVVGTSLARPLRYWDGPLVDEVEDAWKTPQWPKVAQKDWTWEELRIVSPPYWVPTDGRPWRSKDLHAAKLRVAKGKGKTKI